MNSAVEWAKDNPKDAAIVLGAVFAVGWVCGFVARAMLAGLQ